MLLRLRHELLLLRWSHLLRPRNILLLTVHLLLLNVLSLRLLNVLLWLPINELLLRLLLHVLLRRLTDVLLLLRLSILLSIFLHNLHFDDLVQRWLCTRRQSVSDSRSGIPAFLLRRRVLLVELLL